VYALIKASFAARKSQASDDDQFLVPSDSSIPTISHKRSSSSLSGSSRRSSTVDSDEDSFVVPDSGTEVEDAQPRKGKSKSKAATRPSLNKASVGGSNAGGISFLTAAEQREQGKKNDKKAAEDPYSFLQEVKDVRDELFSFDVVLILICIGFLERWGKTRGARIRPQDSVRPEECLERFYTLRKAGTDFNVGS